MKQDWAERAGQGGRGQASSTESTGHAGGGCAWVLRMMKRAQVETSGETREGRDGRRCIGRHMSDDHYETQAPARDKTNTDVVTKLRNINTHHKSR